MRGRSAGGIPMPVSATVTSTRPPATGRALTVTRPPSGVYFTALSTRLMKICASRSRSAGTGGRSDGSWLPRVTRPLSAFGRMIASTDSATSSSRVGASFSDTLPSSMLERSVRSSRRRARLRRRGCPWAALSPAGPEVRVIALSGRPGVVGVGEHGDARRLGRVRLVEVLPVVGERVHALLDPLVLARGAAPEDEHLREPVVGGQMRPDGHLLAPDVLDRLRPRDARIRHEQVDGERAVVGGRDALVGARGELARPPRPGEHRVGVEIPLDLLGRLDAEALRGGAQEAEPLLLQDAVDVLARVLSRLPVRRELADRG